MVRKLADSVGSATPDPMVDMASANSVPQVQISNKPPPGQNGPRGLQPRQTYSRVNTGTPPTPDAGATGQKSMALRGLEFLPKHAEAKAMNMTTKPSINEMVKAAMAGTLSRVDITTEAARQFGAATEKTASPTNGSIPTQDLLKLADAISYIATQLESGTTVESDEPKTAAIKLPAAASGAPAPGTGPAHLHVMKAESEGGPVLAPGGSGGKAEAGGPMESGKHGPAPANAMATNEKMHHGEQPARPMGKVAELAQSNLERLFKMAGIAKEALLPPVDMNKVRSALGTAKKLPGLETGGIVAQMAGKSQAPGGIVSQFAKKAEDAINPAQISAGAAVPPDASGAGEGNLPAPQGSTNLIDSNKAAIDYNKREAKSEAISEVGRVFTETPMKDPVLRQIFEHSGQAGVKTSAKLDSTKIAAARAILSKLASDVEKKKDEKGKEKDSNMGGGSPPPPGVPSPAFTQ